MSQKFKFAMDSRAERARLRIEARHQRFEAEVASRREGGKVTGGLICGMLDQEMAANDPVHARIVAKLKRRFLEETSAVKAFIQLRGRLRKKFRAAGWTVLFVTWVTFETAKHKKVLGMTQKKQKNQKKILSPAEKAKEFMDKVNRGPINEDSPAVIALRAKQQKDIKTAESRMYDSGELTRLKELRAKKKLDDDEKEVIARLEAKLQGMIFAAELERKEKEHHDRKIARMERISENEKKFAQAKLVDRLHRDAKLDRFLRPVNRLRKRFGVKVKTVSQRRLNIIHDANASPRPNKMVRALQNVKLPRLSSPSVPNVAATTRRFTDHLHRVSVAAFPPHRTNAAADTSADDDRIHDDVSSSPARVSSSTDAPLRRDPDGGDLGEEE